MQDPTEKHYSDVGILVKCKDNNYQQPIACFVFYNYDHVNWHDELGQVPHGPLFCSYILIMFGNHLCNICYVIIISIILLVTHSHFRCNV